MKNLSHTARLAGLGYLIIFFTGFFANFHILEGAWAKGDSTATIANILSSPTAFRLGVAAFTIMVAIDILLSLPLYLLSREVSKPWARAAALLRLINGGIFAIAMAQLFRISALIPGGAPALHNEVMACLQQFDRTWDIGLLFFGAHLLALGGLFSRSARIPQWIGWALQFAGAGYLLDSGAQLFYPEYETYQFLFESVVIFAGVAGELSLTLYLLAKGARLRSGSTETSPFTYADPAS